MKDMDARPADLAKVVGVSPAAIHQWLSGASKGPKPENLFLAADHLGVSARWLATGAGPKRVPKRDSDDVPADVLDIAQRIARLPDIRRLALLDLLNLTS